MFSNFEDAFFNDNEGFNDVPKEVIDSLNEKLPEGFEYIDAGEGKCRLIPKFIGEMKLELKMPNDLMEKYNITSWNKLIEYSYRNQTPILVSESGQYPIKINGVSFKFEDVVKFPFDNFTTSKISLNPEPFLPFEINIEDKEIKSSIKVQRQPYDDMNKSLFKNIDNNVLEFTYILDETNQSINFNVQINIDKTNNVEEIVKGLKLYYSCIKGSLKFAGFNLPSTDNGKEGIKETIDFWRKVLEIEKNSGIKFNVSSDVTMGDAMDIEKLYKSLVEKKFYKEYGKLSNIITENAGELDQEYKDSIIKAPGLMLEFIESSEFTLWETAFTTYDCVRLSDIKVKDIILKSKENQEYEFILQPNTQPKPSRFVRHFLKEKEAYEYKTNIKDLDSANLISIN